MINKTVDTGKGSKVIFRTYDKAEVNMFQAPQSFHPIYTFGIKTKMCAIFNGVRDYTYTCVTITNLTDFEGVQKILQNMPDEITEGAVVSSIMINRRDSLKTLEEYWQSFKNEIDAYEKLGFFSVAAFYTSSDNDHIPFVYKCKGSERLLDLNRLEDVIAGMLDSGEYNPDVVFDSVKRKFEQFTSKRRSV